MVRPEEITAILKAQIESFGAETSTVNVGTVVEAGDGIARVHGLSECMYSELVEFENGAMGLALNLEEETVGILVLGDYTNIEEGQQVKTTSRIAEVPVGEALPAASSTLWAIRSTAKAPSRLRSVAPSSASPPTSSRAKASTCPSRPASRRSTP
jgi:hypothetical protein